MKLILAVISVGIMLIFCEFFLRWSGYSPSSYSWEWAINGYFLPNPERIYSLSKNAQRKQQHDESTDNHGFRFDSKDNNLLKAKTTIFMFGDSFVYGHGMSDEETFPFLTQNNLLQLGWDVDIVNSGVPGYGFDQTYLYIHDSMKRYKPTIVIWNINVNDITDANEACLFIPLNKSYFQIPAWLQTLYLQGIIVRKAPRIIRDSYLVNVILKTMEHGHGRYTLGCTLAENNQNEITQRGIDKLQHFMNKIEQEARTNNTQIIYTLMPFEDFFYPALHNNNEMDMKIYLKLKEILAENNRFFIDFNYKIAQNKYPSVLAARYAPDSFPVSETTVLGEFIEASPSSLYIQNDLPGYRHLNEQGNALLARIFVDNFQTMFSRE